MSVAACGAGDTGGTGTAASGGAVAGGRSGLGGIAPSSGGLSNAGGAGNAGGTWSGGTGGTANTGGTPNTGGAASGGSPNTGGTATGGLSGTGGGVSGTGGIGGNAGRNFQYIFVIAMENHDAASIYGNTMDAPYINNQLVPNYAIADNFVDELPSLASEPHYLWMEAGTNAFADHTFTTDNDPSAANSTNDTNHVVTQINNVGGGLSWLSYQEGIDATSGTCPIASSGFYQPKHNPFIFFQDVSGAPPSKINTYCTDHHRPLSALSGDLMTKNVASYNFITPDQCHDMHGQTGCPDKNTIRAGDTWLSTNLPPVIQFAGANAGVIFITWDEGASTTLVPFIAVGPTVKVKHTSSVLYDHSSLVKSLDEMLGLPVLQRVVGANDFADLFTVGAFP
ncbi:MAG TPA: alkaline phosphatase family protein, partial [Polyangiaceae bacterium]